MQFVNMFYPCRLSILEKKANKRKGNQGRASDMLYGHSSGGLLTAALKLQDLGQSEKNVPQCFAD